MFRDPVSAPVLCGLKITFVLHDAPAASEVPQVSPESEKFPVVLNANPASDAPPGFETVTLAVALELPTSTPPKASVCGFTCSPAAAKPVPVSVTTSGVTPAVVLAIVNVPVTAPTAVGAKSTCIEQLFSAASEVEHRFCVSWNGDVTVKVNPAIASVPTSVIESFCAVLICPCDMFPKSSSVLLPTIEAAATAVPLRLTVTGGASPEALETVNTPVRSPSAVGVNVTVA